MGGKIAGGSENEGKKRDVRTDKKDKYLFWGQE